MAERIVLDPSEMITGRSQLDITDWIGAEGINWGDAEMTPYQAPGRIGSLPVDMTIPNRQVEIPIILQTRGTVTFASIRDTLQNKVGLYQAEGGVVRRVQSDGGTVYADVVGASLTIPGSWLHAMRDTEPDASLRLECLPDFYEAETQLADHVETTQPELIFTNAEPQRGHLPGRVRIVVDEDQGQIQRGLLWGIRSRYYDSAATAALSYEAETRLLYGTSAIVTLTGASGGGANNAVQTTNLASTWTPLLSTTSSASAFCTHKGTYRVWARCYSASGNAVQLRLSWDVGDLLQPVINDPWRFPQASTFWMADLGTISLRETTGIHRWEGQIQAKGSAGGEEVHIDKIYLQPLDDGGGVLRAARTGFGESTLPVARDDFNQVAGALNAKVAPVGGTWATSGVATDFNVSGTPNFNVTRTAVSDATLDPPRLAVLGATSYTDTHEFISIARSADYTGTAPNYGLIARYVDANNWLKCFWTPGVSGVGGSFSVVKRVASVNTTIATNPPETPITAALTAVLDLYVYADGTFDAYCYVNGTERSNATLVCTLNGYDAVLATGGTLATGKPGFFDYHPSATATTRTYDHFYVQSAPSDAVMFASRSCQLTTDGMFRQDSTGAAYGPVSWVEGDLPRIPPSRPEGRTVQVFIKGSRGDFDTLPDTGIDDISARLNVKPCDLYTRS